MKYTKLAIISVVLLATISMVTSFALEKFYARYESIEKSLAASSVYDGSTANAIKHATAAADMFKILRVAMSDDNAERTVIALGVMNEYLEQVIYPNDQDSAREIMKDLHNNYVGINAAKVTENTDTFKIILSFANNRTLIVNQIYNPFFDEKEPKEDVVAFGYNWFDHHRAEINDRIEMKLKRARELKHLDSFRISSTARKSPTVE